MGEDDGEKRQAWFKGMWEGQSEQAEANQEETKNAVQLDEDKNEDDEDFGDDFDDFAEGEGNDDFGDFDEAEDAVAEEQHAPPQPQHTAPDTLAGLVSSSPKQLNLRMPPIISLQRPCVQSTVS